MWKKLRIGILLYVLLMVAAGAWLTRARSTDWADTLWVTLHPINGDGSDAAAAYINALRRSDFTPIAAFFQTEAEYHGVDLDTPVRVELGGEVHEQPPVPPASRNPVRIALWSLRLRLWVFSVDKSSTVPADVNIFVKYYDPQTSPRLAHSLGLQEGMIGVVNAFASEGYAGSNNVVIAHELLHTLGAVDKYDPVSNQPVYPDGFADPEAAPLYPQKLAEIMAGRIPISEGTHRMPRSLESVIIGDVTALEIGFGDD